jgi:uncharacterized protein YkwD
MKRRAVLSMGAASLMVGSAVLIPRWPLVEGTDQIDTAFQKLAQVRRDAGLPVLSQRSVLVEMGRRQGAHMERLGQTSHLDAEGCDPVVRAQQAGYQGRILGEALAETYYGPVETVDAWLLNDATNDVLMDPSAGDLGLALVVGQDGRRWWNLVTGAA